jgi:FkbH-like protein
LKNEYHQLTPTELDAISQDILAYVESCLANIRIKSHALVLWPSFESYLYTAFGISDNSFNSGINGFILHLNMEISKIFERYSDCYFIQTDRLCARVGEANFYDHVRSLSAAAPYSIIGLKTFALEFSKYIRALKGQAKKCIVLDCDNTLWKGIVGESDISSLVVGKAGYPSEAYYNFQIFVKLLSDKGIVIALCSKNNEADVWTVFDNHPGMLLKKEDITAYRINWNNKADNIREIAQELNLGLDSFFFVDDSAFECNLIIETLPEVDVIQMKYNPLETIQEIIERGLFDQYTMTDEDKKRHVLYADEAQRKKVKVGAVDLPTYLKSLKINIEITIDDVNNIARIAQLTQKTNQFNCTTKRYSEADILAFMTDTQSHVFALQVADKFGDLGTVGVIVTSLVNNNDVKIDTFLMSCRALGRQIEAVFLSELCSYFKTSHKVNLMGMYMPTNKNSQVRNFFSTNGFSKESESDELTTFLLALNSFKKKDHIFDSVTIIT